MKRLFFLIPLLFWGIRPYQQPIKQNVQVANEELTKFEKDTISLSIINTNLKVEIMIDAVLTEKEKYLKGELKKLEAVSIKKQRNREQKIRYHIDKYENRGL